MNIKGFFDTEFKVFSNLDNVRSIPSLVDGLKDSQRKAVYGMMVHGGDKIKVAQAAGKFALATHYAHGETSMADTIVGLAQDFPGSNNVNLFQPIGQFGSILSSESSSHRYIFTKPHINMRLFFKKEDDCILKYRYEDGDKAEPELFFPILPMWILNGSLGIGTGHSVKILPRDVEKISILTERLLNGDNMQERTIKRLMKPSYKGWTGDIVEVEDEEGKFEIHGKIEKVNTTTLKVTELPVGYGVDKFKAILVDLMDKGTVKDYDNNSSENGFDFEIKVPRDVGKKSIDDLKKLFKLVTRVTENVTLWKPDGRLKRYRSAFDALQDFVEYRKGKFEDRRCKLIELATEDMRFLNAKKLFIKEWNDLANPGKMNSSDIQAHMSKAGVDDDFIPRLMQLRVSSLAMDLIKELENEIKTKQSYIKELESKTPDSIFIEELNSL